MRRVVVLGGLGFFGRAAVARLRADGFRPLTASRSPAADLRLDLAEPNSLRGALRAGDVVVDTAGPFQERTTALVEAALEMGFDLIDISDSLAYVSRLYRLQAQIEAAGIRVLTACSSVSAVGAALIRLSGLEPARVVGVLAAATRATAQPGSARSLLHSVGRPVRLLRDGRLVTRVGWRESQRFRLPPPLGALRGYLYECPDPLTMRRVWPGLRAAEFYVDTRVPGLNALLALAARWRSLRRLVERLQSPGLALARLLGAKAGCLAYGIEGQDGRVARYALLASDRAYLTAIAPAVLAARAIAAGRFVGRGLVPVDRHVEPAELLDYLRPLGVVAVRLA
ncbi:MAG: hypothetical protein ACRDHL_11220 [Candidatus Promineifilaceae bacterium]